MIPRCLGARKMEFGVRLKPDLQSKYSPGERFAEVEEATGRAVIR